MTKFTSAVSRRGFLFSLTSVAAARSAFAQRTGPPIRARALNHATLTVSDVKRSTEFYQGLFGMPIQARQGGTVALRIGAGPQALALSAGAAPSINHFCLGVDDFNVDRLVKVLTDRGLSKAEGAGGLGGGPMKVRVRMRGPEAGGAPQGTPELYFGDPDGIVVQLQDPGYCGGGGVLGNMCAAVEPAPTKGLIAVRDLSHFTIFISDASRSNAFYRDLFGFAIRSYQGPTAPTLAVGSGVEFLMFAGVAGAGGGRAASTPSIPPSINHLCLSMDGFNVDRVLKTLESYGIKPRENAQGPVGPLRSYVTMRMENRGGAKEGTPELYLTDPDGILLQIQDVRYCGGSGVLGDGCPA